MTDKRKGLECRECGHEACEHLTRALEVHVVESIKLHSLLETAATIAGEKITGKTLPEEHVRRVVDMIIREEGMVTWMTLDEYTAAQLDRDYRDNRIAELMEQVVGLEKKVRGYEVQEDKKAD